MKRLLSSILLLALTAGAFSQTINYQKTIDEALSQAQKSNKPVFIMVSAPVNSLAAPQNLNFVSGTDAKEVVDFYNKRFVSYKASVADSAGIKLRDQYQLSIFPAYIFLDAKGGLVYKDGKNSRDAERYIDMAKQAIAHIESGKTLSYYEQLDKDGKITGDQLKEYILYKEKLQLFDNGPLIEEYVDYLTVKSFDDYNTVLFVLQASPLAFGKAYNLCLTNKKIFDSVYKREPLGVRADINNHIISYTIKEAIKTKNARMALNGASFAQGTWSKQDPRQGYKTYLSNMMAYYKGVKDTLHFFQQAGSYYDTYYMNITADSARKMQQKALQETLTRKIDQNEIAIPPQPKNGNNTYTAGIVVKSTAPLDVAARLNTGAWDFYTLGTKNPNNLAKALLWVRRAIQLEPKGFYYDTMAHILYRLNFYEEAVADESKAIEMATAELQPKSELDNMKNELQKIKAKSL